MTNETSTNRPTHRVFAVTKKPKADKGIWTPIGAAWPHRDGKGFNLPFAFMPIKEAEIVIRTAEPRDGGAQ